jgi:hypothetical protein
MKQNLKKEKEKKETSNVKETSPQHGCGLCAVNVWDCRQSKR